MKNCSNCGVEKKGSEKFCINCGNKFEVVVEQPKARAAAPNQPKRSTITPKQRKLRIAGIVSVTVFLLGLLGGHLFLKSKYDVSKTINEMNQAYIKNEQALFLSFFSVADNVVKDEEGFYSFVEDQDWEDIRDQMKSEVKQLETESLSNIIKDSEGNKFISVVNDPILFGLYDRISFLVHPVKVETEIPMDNATIVMNDKTVTGATGENVVVGNFLPGSYSWSASVPSEFSPIEAKGSIEVSGDGRNVFVFTPSFEAGMITVTSDISDAVLWVNGKSTGKTVKEMNSIGPVPFNGKVEITAQAKNENNAVVKGDIVKVESDTAHIKFAHIQEKVATDRAKQQEAEELQQLEEEHEIPLTDFIDSFRYVFEDALNYQDFSYIADYFPTGSQIQTDYFDDIERHAALEVSYYYDFQSNTITSVKAIDTNTFVVNTAEMFFFTSNEQEFKYDKTKAYTIKVQGDEYLIHSIEVLKSEFVEI
ncbi:TcaA 3rd/4th domain-containing protein [Paenisporosarcina indica]|uniref:TcaA 3rd/4th domain-containing protein n=1 Tax=Paenisporosarcina indica TaxID=650093 RepID=UPI0009501C76|nr:hypothetical protein [Paenisporosarcina indica]